MIGLKSLIRLVLTLVFSIIAFSLIGIITRFFSREIIEGISTLIILGIPISIILFFGRKNFKKLISELDYKDLKLVQRVKFTHHFLASVGIILGILIGNITFVQWRAIVRVNSNEACAIGSLKTLAAAQTDYNNNSAPHTNGTLEKICEEHRKHWGFLDHHQTNFPHKRIDCGHTLPLFS